MEEWVKQALITREQIRLSMGLTLLTEICEWCKGPVEIMCQRGTGVCSQQCAKMASKILFDTQEKAEKFGGGYAPSQD